MSPHALELMFSGAEVVVEAGRDPHEARAYATVMLTIDLDRLSGLVREPNDAETARRLIELMGVDAGVKQRLRKLARPYLSEAAELSIPARRIEIEHAVRQVGNKILIDVDAMVSLRARKGAKGPGERGRDSESSGGQGR